MNFENRMLLIAALNVFAFMVFAWDKLQARRGKRRVSEWRLLLVTMAGGELGAVTAMALIRHKTSKRSFQWKFYPSFIIGLAVSYAIITA